MNKKTKQYIAMGAAAFIVIAATASISSTALASGRGGMSFMGFGRGMFDKNLTDEQISELKTKQDAVNVALSSGDYSAWVNAVKALDEDSPQLTRITADNFKTYSDMHKLREANYADQKTKIDAIRTALESGDYNAWVVAVKAENINSSILEKITADNFSKYVEAHRLRTQADNIMSELGLERGYGNGIGMGYGMRGVGDMHEKGRGGFGMMR